MFRNQNNVITKHKYYPACNYHVTIVGYCDHGLKNIFPDIFMVVSLHISLVLYISTSHAQGIVFSFKTLDLSAFQKSSSKNVSFKIY
jgi:hypothetical protein